jgi:hypothetical protein
MATVGSCLLQLCEGRDFECNAQERRRAWADADHRNDLIGGSHAGAPAGCKLVRPTEVRDVDMMRTTGAAHVQRAFLSIPEALLCPPTNELMRRLGYRSCRSFHPEMDEERLHLVEVGRRKAHERHLLPLVGAVPGHV